MEFGSKYLEKVVDHLSRFPGIGKKTALRLALNLMKRGENDMDQLVNSIQDLKKNVKTCSLCYNLSDNEVCGICSNPKRNPQLICVLENLQDVIAVENTGQFNGVYHLLGGVISPIDGVGPGDLRFKELWARVEKEDISEIILALPATMEGDTTCFYISRHLEKKNIKISIIARGIGVGDELEYADEITLGRSILNRVPYNKEEEKGL